MFINDTIITLLNYRISEEEKSSKLYRAMAIKAELAGLAGAAKLWNKYADEELTHAKWSYDYLLSLNIQPEVPELPTPEYEYEGLEKMIIDSLAHEETITEQCNGLTKSSFENNDFMTYNLGLKYMAEQREELEKMLYWKDQVELYGENGKLCPSVLKMIDTEMGSK
jgi:ferritin